MWPQGRAEKTLGGARLSVLSVSPPSGLGAFPGPVHAGSAADPPVVNKPAGFGGRSRVQGRSQSVSGLSQRTGLTAHPPKGLKCRDVAAKPGVHSTRRGWPARFRAGSLAGVSEV